MSTPEEREQEQRDKRKGRHRVAHLARHRWKETGEVESAATDPVTAREQCEVCGVKCWHYHGVQGFRFRKGRDRAEAEGREVTRDEMRMEAIVEEDETCPCPNPDYGVPRPVEPRAPGGIEAKPRKLNTNWTPEALKDFRKLTDEDLR